MEKEQIVKALEFCTDDNSICLHCPVRGRCNDDSMFLEKAALSLIREQEKRIEELEAENEKLKKPRYMVYSDGRSEMIPSVESVRADTVRKMRERLKDRYEFDCNADEDNALYYEDLCEWVERIEKELLEEDSNNDTE